jgi:glycosyltransferase involved in cell wall biosynthesis
LRLLFDGFWWHNGPPSGHLVLREMVLAWRRQFPADDLALAIPARDLASPCTPIPAGVTVLRTHGRLHPIINGSELPLLSRRSGGFDAIIAQNFAPLAGTTAVFIHDAEIRTHPQWFTRAERVYLAPLPAMARRATVVATSTQSERDRIRRHIAGLDEVVATGLGIPSELVTEPATEPADLNLQPGKFVLSVGRLNVRKNLERMIAAALASGVVHDEYPLVVVGPDSGQANIFDSAPAGTVRYVGYRSMNELRWLYENCAMFLYVSLDEGFGLPPVEAHALGAPVIVSDIPATRETLGGASGVTFVNPVDTNAIAATIRDTTGVKRQSATPVDPAVAWNRCVEVIRGALVGAMGRCAPSGR